MPEPRCRHAGDSWASLANWTKRCRGPAVFWFPALMDYMCAAHARPWARTVWNAQEGKPYYDEEGRMRAYFRPVAA